MIRVEVICSNSVNEDVLDAFKKEGVAKFYTQYPNVHGIGSHGPRMGDAVWPEENSVFVIWCEEAEARGIQRAVEKVKKNFPDEGLEIFAMWQATKKALQWALEKGPDVIEAVDKKPPETEMEGFDEAAQSAQPEPGPANPVEAPEPKPAAAPEPRRAAKPARKKAAAVKKAPTSRPAAAPDRQAAPEPAPVMEAPAEPAYEEPVSQEPKFQSPVPFVHIE
jgi:hypothetical protein